MSHGDLSTGTRVPICGSIQFSPETNRMIPPKSVANAMVMVLFLPKTTPAKTVAQATYTIVS